MHCHCMILMVGLFQKVSLTLANLVCVPVCTIHFYCGVMYYTEMCFLVETFPFREKENINSLRRKRERAVKW